MDKKKVLDYIRENKMIEKGHNIVVGVSGGADSMCLLNILISIREELQLNLVAVHVHHGIRGESADRDAKYVSEYCAANNVKCIVKYFDVPKLAEEMGMSHEETGRYVRYEAFREVLADMPAGGSIAVAHNADDNAETVLFNILRGTGLKGMTGIRPVRDHIIRPILCLTREEIEEYNKENNILYVQDETNLTEDYTRNKIRLGVLPKAREINPKASEHINMTAESLGLIEDYIKCELDKIYGDVVDNCTDKTVTINTVKFLELHKAMKIEVVKKCLYEVAGLARDITKQHIDWVLALFDMTVGKRVSLPYGMVAIREYESVAIRKESMLDKGALDESYVTIDGEGEYNIKLAGNNGKLTVESDVFSTEIFEENRCTKWIDCDIMKSNLQVRTRRKGDYIILDESGSRKKLKDFFIDKKIPKEERDNILLVANGSDIVWIFGYRLSGAYMVTEDSLNIIRLQIDYER